MDPDKTITHTYTVTETTHHVPAIYWLNEHYWLDNYERVKNNPDVFDIDKCTIMGVRFDPNETPNESDGNPDGRSIWLTIRYNYEMELPPDNPHHAGSLAECSTGDSNLTKTETILEHLGYSYETHEVVGVRLDENKDGLRVTVCERIDHPVKSAQSKKK